MAKRGFGREISGENNPAHRRRGVRKAAELKEYAARLEDLRGALLAASKQVHLMPGQEIEVDSNTKLDSAIEYGTLFLRSLRRALGDAGMPIDNINVPWLKP